MSGENTLEIQDLTFGYPDYPGLPSAPLFRGLDMELEGGTGGLVVGLPETGKSTLTRILAGLIPRHTGGRLTGSIQVNGRDPMRTNPWDLLEDVGVVFQSSEAQIITTRCDTEVAFALESLGIPAAEIRRRVKTSLALLGLERYGSRSPATLSDGERKKLLLACLYAADPAVFILDETLEEIDPPTRSAILRRLRQTGKTRLILSSKLLEEPVRHSRRIYLLEGGAAVRSEGPELDPDLASRAQRLGILRMGGRSTPGDRFRPGSGGAGATDSCAADSGEPVLRAGSVTFRYPDNPDFSLSLDEITLHSGQVLAVLGRNGSGKSTLGRILCGLLRPASGTLEIREGTRWTAGRAERLQRFTAYMFQNPDLQIFLPTVREELAFGLERLGLPEPDIRQRASRSVERFRLPGLEVPPTVMSYGARKRLQAAVYHLLDRPVVILDEADSGLSPGGCLEIIGLFLEQHRSVVIVTHDLRFASSAADRIAVLENGRLAGLYGVADFSHVERHFARDGSGG